MNVVDRHQQPCSLGHLVEQLGGSHTQPGRVTVDLARGGQDLGERAEWHPRRDAGRTHAHQVDGFHRCDDLRRQAGLADPGGPEQEHTPGAAP